MNRFILYGAASIGNIVKDVMEKCGFYVAGYMDQRAFELKMYNGLPVWGLDDVPEIYRDMDIMIYIAVKNVFEHERIASQLADRGFKNIIYKPYSALLGYADREECRMSELYDTIFEGKQTGEVLLPAVRKERTLHDFAVIKKENEKVTAYIPAEFIFTNDYKNTPMEKWGNICILAFFTHINFFRFLSGQKGAGPEDYLQEYCVFTAGLQHTIKVTDAWKNNVIENRTQIYEQMKEAMDLDPDFFIRNAAEAVWNDRKKCFNLTAGKHRCTFQAAIGRKYIPLKLLKTDYEKFYHASALDEVLCQLAGTCTETSIPHPVCYRGSYVRDRGEYAFFMWFARFYGKKLYDKYGSICFQKLNIVDFTRDHGNFARFCTRLGCRVKRKKYADSLEEHCNQLFYADQIIYFEEISRIKNSIIIADADDGIFRENSGITMHENTWLIKNAEKKKAYKFAKDHSLRIVEEISSRYWKGSILISCLMEGDFDGPVRKQVIGKSK